MCPADLSAIQQYKQLIRNNAEAEELYKEVIETLLTEKTNDTKFNISKKIIKKWFWRPTFYYLTLYPFKKGTR